MHNDLEDIMRIANCAKKKCSREDALFVLGKVCSFTKDKSRQDKNIEFKEQRETLIDSFQEVLGQISVLCKQG